MIGLFKTEVIHRRGPWRSFEAEEFATLEWVDWFNYRRRLEPIGNVPSAEAAALLCSHQGTSLGGLIQTKWLPENPGRFIQAVVNLIPRRISDVSDSASGAATI